MVSFVMKYDRNMKGFQFFDILHLVGLVGEVRMVIQVFDFLGHPG